MNYTKKTFSIAVGGAKYAEGWDAIFKKPSTATVDTSSTIQDRPRCRCFLRNHVGHRC